ncbi:MULTISPECIES: SAM-dependent methyltransferase [unclassified Streptomyces]|uniref:SAM-dependent methyltransferase n=1 Tax=unclassified Streptomyces TaxID=2593676 RepID=UPI00136F2407|nr:SAM-dependent methyltransferase [Streptomyces sp. SID6139]MYR22012.1 SAM-dependent methyltransferase [Streptomyces sp. SID6137]
MTDECAHSETTARPPDWDARAAGFDEEPDHGLRDPAVRAAWAARLRSWLPGHLADVLDLGCGTGSLSLLAAQQLPPVPQQPGLVGRCPPHMADEDHVEAAFPHRGDRPVHTAPRPGARRVRRGPARSWPRTDQGLTRCPVSAERLSGDAVLWGKEVTDERYAVVAGV